MIKRNKLIKELEELEDRAYSLRKRLRNIPIGLERTNGYNELNNLKRTILVIESQVASILPVTIEGFLGEDTNEVDQDENGRLEKVIWYLGCPVLDSPFSRTPIAYNFQNDISEIFEMNKGKYLRVTIETVDNREKCSVCPDRFKCFTKNWKFF